MKQRGRGRSGSDLVAGIVAAVAFLGMVFALGMNLLLAGVLAGAVYVGVALLGRQVQTEPREPTDAELLQRIEQLLPAVTDLRVRRKIAGLVGEARTALAYLQQHPNQDGGWRPLIRDCLASTQMITYRYADLQRFVDDPHAQPLANVEEMLDQVSQTFANFRRRLVDDGAEDLSAQVEMFRSTLQAMDELNAPRREVKTHDKQSDEESEVLRQRRGNP